MKTSVSFYKTVPAGHLHLSGADAATFLNSQFSADLRTLEAGLCVYGLWLNAKGKVLADSWVLCRDAESFEIVSMGTGGSKLREMLERHIIADEVEMEVQEGTTLLMVQGEGAEGAVSELFGAVPAVGRFMEGEGAVCYPGRRARGGHFDACISEASAAEAAVAKLQAAGAVAVEAVAIELERIAAGYPAIPKELGAEDLPGEAGLVGEAVCTTKGCFLGQESVLRLHNLGQARRGLYRVSGAGSVPELPAALMLAGEERAAGELRSAYVTDSGWTGVAILKLNRMGPGLLCEGAPVTAGAAMGVAP
jgi:folate-binding protein YgfZ